MPTKPSRFEESEVENFNFWVVLLYKGTSKSSWKTELEDVYFGAKLSEIHICKGSSEIFM